MCDVNVQCTSHGNGGPKRNECTTVYTVINFNYGALRRVQKLKRRCRHSHFLNQAAAPKKPGDKTDGGGDAERR